MLLHKAIYEDTVGAGIVSSLGPAAWFRANTGITVTGSGVSQWDDQSGNARPLLQGTDANRPIGLIHSGTNYLYLPGVAGNYASTPDSVPASITGDIDIRVRVALDDWTPSSAMSVFSKADSNTTRSYYLTVNATVGTLVLASSPDGTAGSQVSGTSSAAPTVNDREAIWIRVTLDVDDGAGNRVYKFYTAADSDSEPSSWTQLGTTQTVAGATSIHDNSSVVEVGSVLAGTTQVTAGRIYRAAIYSTIGGSTPVVDFNAADGTDGAASFVSSTTGETWTINSTGSKPAQIVARSSILFDGAAHFLKATAFTLNQPETVFILFKQVSWTSQDRVFDGNAVNDCPLIQATSSPGLYIFAGTATIGPVSPAIGTYAAIASVFNGASSLIQQNLGTPVTGNAGAANPGGFTLGANATPGGYSNIQVVEVIIFPSALSTANIARVQRYLSRVGQLAF